MAPCVTEKAENGLVLSIVKYDRPMRENDLWFYGTQV